MKRFFRYFVILIAILLPTASFSLEIKHIKLAIFDNPEIDSSESTLSEDAKIPYAEGIDTAIYAAKQKGIIIVKKDFFFGNNLLDILQKAPVVKSWEPDVVLGLHASNAALMSDSLFPGNLVISISASDVQLSNISSNFYSLGTPDLYSANQVINFIGKEFPHRNLFLIVGADGKESVDLANLISSLYKQNNPKQTVHTSEFLSDDPNTMETSSLVKGYNPGDIVLIFAISRFDKQIILMNKIADYLSPNKLVFITTVDNWKGRNLTQNTNYTANPYTSFRVATSFIDPNSKDYINFINVFQKLYHREPTDDISFIAYQSVISFVKALENFPPPKKLSTKQAVLWSYQQAIKSNPDWFKFKPIVVYKVEGNKEIYYTSLPNNQNKGTGIHGK